MTAQAAMDIGGIRTKQARFHDLIERHRGIVFKVAGLYARAPEDRADLAQEILAQGWRAFAKYDPARAFPTWLYRIALNVAISFARHREHRDGHTVAFDETVHDLADERGGNAGSEERLRALRRAIGLFGALDHALLLFYLDERSQREIAEILGLTEINVATKIARLKQRLRERLAEYA